LGAALVAACIILAIAQQSSRFCASGIEFRKSATEAPVFLVFISAMFEEVVL
jgi:hypothetical protein